MRTATGDIPLGPTCLAAGGLDHGYALTTHQAQGLTTDAALLLGGDHLYREAGYVALSRGRTRNAIYLADQPDNLTHCPELPHSPPREGADNRDPHAALTRALNTDRAQTMASQLLRSSATNTTDSAHTPHRGCRRTTTLVERGGTDSGVELAQAQAKPGGQGLETPPRYGSTVDLRGPT